MTINQLSIFVENKAGALGEITHILAEENIDIRAMSIADTKDFGILRLIVSDEEKAKKVLQKNDCIVSITEVVGIAITDEPGSLSRVMELLYTNGINVEYMYAFITISKQYAYVVVRVEDNNKAMKILETNGVKLVSKDDIKNL